MGSIAFICQDAVWYTLRTFSSKFKLSAGVTDNISCEFPCKMTGPSKLMSNSSTRWWVKIAYYFKSNRDSPWFEYYIKNNAWVTANNDFWPRVRWLANDFHEWRSHDWKSLANHLTSDQKSLFTITNVLFYFLHAILFLEHTISLQTIIDRSLRHCRYGRSFLT